MSRPFWRLWRRRLVAETFDPPITVETADGPWLVHARLKDGTFEGEPKPSWKMRAK